MDDITFASGSLISIKDSWIGGSGGDVLKVSGNSSCYIEISDRKKLKSAKYIKLEIKYSSNTKSERYNPVLMCGIDCYNDANEGTGVINNISLICNNDSLVDGISSYQTIASYNSGKINKVTIHLDNLSSKELIIHEIKLYTSIDVDVNQIIEVVNESTISADVMMSLTSWVSNLQVDSLETNIMSISTISSFIEKRNFIKIKDWGITFNESLMSTSETEHLCLEMPDGAQVPLYWTAINEHPQAYKYITTTKPQDIYPDLPVESLDGFKFMIYKASDTKTKLSIEFNEYVDSIGNKTGIPRIVFGAGTDKDNPERGKGVIEKDDDEFKLEYTKSNGSTVGVYMGESGGRLVGFDSAGGGGKPLNDIAFYTDGFYATYGSDTTKYKYITDNGRLVGIDVGGTLKIKISYNGGTIG